MATVLAFERYPVDPKALETYEKLVAEILDHMRRASGALWADAAAAFDDSPSYVLWSEWRTRADLDAWRGSEEANRFHEAVFVLLRGDITSRTFSSS